MDTPPVGNPPTQTQLPGDAGDFPTTVVTDTISSAESILAVSLGIGLANAGLRAVEYEKIKNQIDIISGMFTSVGLNAQAEITKLSAKILTATSAWKDWYDATKQMNTNIDTYKTGLQSATDHLNTTIAVNNWQDIYDKVQTMSQDITTYLGSMQTAVDNLNQVITNYKNGTATQAQLTAAISQYNTDATNASDIYSPKATAYNSAMQGVNVADLNTLLTHLGLPTINPLPQTAPDALSITSGPFAPPSASTSAASMSYVGILQGSQYVASFSQQNPFFDLSFFSSVPAPPSLSAQDTTDLATAIDTYNTTAETLNSVYSQQVALYNGRFPSQVNDLNQKFNDAQMPLLSPQPSQAQDAYSITSGSFAPPSSSTPPITPVGNTVSGVVNVSSVNDLLLYPATDGDALALFLPSLAGSVVSAYLPPQKTNATILKFISQALNSVDPYAGDVTLPDAYYRAQTPPGVSFASASPGATSPAVGSSRFGLPGVFARVLENNLYDALGSESAKNLSDSSKAKLLNLPSSILQKLSPQIATTLARQFPNIDEKNSPNAAEAASGLEVASQIQKFVESGDVQKAVEELLKTFPELAQLSPTEKASIAKELGAAINLALLNIAVTTFAFALKLPGLTAQVLGNVQGVPPLGTLFANSETNQLKAMVNSPETIAALKSLFDSESDVKAINAAIDKALLKGYLKSKEEFRKILEKELVDARIEKKKAEHLADEVMAFFEKQSNLPAPESPFNIAPLRTILDELTKLPPPDRISGQRATAAIIAANASLNGGFPVGSPNRFLVESLINEINKNPVIGSQINQALAEPISSNRDLYNNVVSRLTANGIATDEAEKVATLAVKLITPKPSATGVVTNPLPTSAADTATISQEVTDQVTANLSKELGDQRARNLGTLAAQTAINFVHLYDKQLDESRFDQKSANQNFADNIISLSSPSYMLDALNTVLPQFVIEHAIKAYSTPSAQGDLGKIDVNKQPLSWRGSYIFPV